MRLAVVISVVALVAVLGAGLYVTDFTAYLSNDPTTCNNCHVMDYAYENWYHAGHEPWATCSDCHMPHAFIPKYLVKAESGFRHVTAFIFGPIPEAIRARDASRRVVNDNCIECHHDTVEDIIAWPMPMGRYCFDCHRTSGHGERGISTLPYQHVEGIYP